MRSGGVERVEPGERIGEKYEVVRVLGEGGMGIVVAAKELERDRLVAIKIVRRGLLDGDEAVQRFQLEARTLGSLTSEHVVRILNVGQNADGTPFMVMEYLEGADLGHVAKERAPLPIETSVGWLLQAIEGLSEAHRAGIVHRDLKPSNLFLAKSAGGKEIVKVLDFGIAKSLAGGPALTKEGFVLGSPSYMSPEQLQSSRSLDARTDVWALGAILYELLTGREPFEGKSLEQRLRAILSGSRPRLRELRAGVPIELEAVIDDCLMPSLERRIGDLAELERRLLPFGPAAARQSFADDGPPSPRPAFQPPRALAAWMLISLISLALIAFAVLVALSAAHGD